MEIELIMEIKFNNEDFEFIKNQFLISIRGTKSQNWMSRRLGYTYNQYGKWESNNKKLNWSDFEEICNLRKIKLHSELNRIYNIALPNKVLIGGVLLANIFKMFFSSEVETLANFLKVSPQTLRRWLPNKQDIPTELIFKALSFRPQLFLIFIYSLRIINIPEKFESSLNMYLKLYSTESLFPYISAIHAFINTREYQLYKAHSDKKVANRLGLSEMQVKMGIDLLLKNQALKWVNDKYSLNLSGIEQKGIPNSDLIRSLRYWYYKTLCFLGKKAKNEVSTTLRSLSGCRVVAISNELSDKVASKLSETYSEISKMILEDETDPEVVRILTLNFFDFADAPDTKFSNDSELGLMPII